MPYHTVTNQTEQNHLHPQPQSQLHQSVGSCISLFEVHIRIGFESEVSDLFSFNFTSVFTLLLSS